MKREKLYKLIYLPSFDSDLSEAEDYLFGFNSTAVDKLTEAIDEQMATLIEHPFIYPAYRKNTKYRFMLLPYQYLCFYCVDEETKTIHVYRLLRGMRDIPSILS